jgi:hypothetical protein
MYKEFAWLPRILKLVQWSILIRLLGGEKNKDFIVFSQISQFNFHNLDNFSADSTQDIMLLNGVMNCNRVLDEIKADLEIDGARAESRFTKSAVERDCSLVASYSLCRLATDSEAISTEKITKAEWACAGKTAVARLSLPFGGRSGSEMAQTQEAVSSLVHGKKRKVIINLQTGDAVPNTRPRLWSTPPRPRLPRRRTKRSKQRSLRDSPKSKRASALPPYPLMPHNRNDCGLNLFTFGVSVVEHPLPSVALNAADARHNPVFEGDYLYVIHVYILQ